MTRPRPTRAKSRHGRRSDILLVAAPAFVHLKVHSAYSLLEGALPIAKLAKLAAANQFAGARPHRHQQSVRRARILRKALGRRHAADRRLHARCRFRRRRRAAAVGAPSSKQRAARQAATDNSRCCAMNADGYRQSDEACRMRISNLRRSRRRTSKSRSSRKHPQGLIALTGGPDGPIDAALRGGQTRPGSGAAEDARENLRRSALCRAATPRPRRRS